MSDNYSAFNLIGLLAGLLHVDGTDTAKTGPDYYRPSGKLLDPEINFDWFESPKKAFQDIEHRGWLLEAFFKDDTGLFGDTDPHASFRALSSPPDAIWRFFSSIIQPGDGNTWPGDPDKFKELTKPDAETKRKI